MRNTKTEYVSCPSCGRTLFDLQEITEQIRTRTGHLPGVSIAVMGCIVNGPGEMADADFGYALLTRLLRVNRGSVARLFASPHLQSGVEPFYAANLNPLAYKVIPWTINSR